MEPSGKVAKIAGGLVLALWLLFLVPLLLRWVGVFFMPAPEMFAPYVPKAALIFGAGVGIVTFVLAFRSPESRERLPRSPVLAVLTLAFGVVLTAFAALEATMVAVPMARAAVGQGDVTIAYRVTDPETSGSRKGRCRPAVKVDVGSFMFGEVCGVPKQLRDVLQPGRPILLHGRGNRWGVFYDRFSR